MTRRIAVAATVMAMVVMAPAAPAAGQIAGRLGVEPYIAYGFFGELPDGGPTLEAAVAYGGRALFQLSPQFAAFGNYQRSTPEVTDPIAGGGELSRGTARVDHWSAGVEFSYIPRGGAEGMLPILLEAGLGQARYDGGSDLAANLGIASALRFTPNLSLRYGANDYISDFDGRGIVNQIFVRVGAELRM